MTALYLSTDYHVFKYKNRKVTSTMKVFLINGHWARMFLTTKTVLHFKNSNKIKLVSLVTKNSSKT